MAAARPDGPLGRLITVEGVEGAGKSTQAENLRAWLRGARRARRRHGRARRDAPRSPPAPSPRRRRSGHAPGGGPALRREPRRARPARDPAGARAGRGRPVRSLRGLDGCLSGVRARPTARDHRPVEPAGHGRPRARPDAGAGSRRRRGSPPGAGAPRRAGRLRPLRAAGARVPRAGAQGLLGDPRPGARPGDRDRRGSRPGRRHRGDRPARGPPTGAAAP